MAEEARVFFLRKRRERAEDTERRALLEGLGQTRSLIARYSYLLRRVKELDGEAQAQPG